MGKDLNRHLSKEDTEIANKHMKIMQMKTTRRCHLTPPGMTIISFKME